MQKANLMNFDRNREKINTMFQRISFKLLAHVYVSPLPNAISKSPATKLNDSTSTHRSFLKKGLQLSLSLKDIVGFLNFLSLSAELVLLLYLGLY